MATYEALIPAGATIKIGATEGTVTSVGKLDGDCDVTITQQRFTKKDNKGDGVIDAGINPEVMVNGTMIAFDPDVISDMNSGFFTKSTVAASPVSGAEDTIASGAWSYNTHIPLTGQDGDGTVQTINSVTAGTDGALTANVDYITHYNTSTKNWGIIILDSTTVTTLSQAIVINYDYTPAATNTYKFGATSYEISTKVVVLEYVDPSTGNTFTWTVYKARQDDDMVFKFLGSGTEDVNTYAFSLKGQLDTSRTAGDMLGKFVETIA